MALITLKSSLGTVFKQKLQIFLPAHIFTSKIYEPFSCHVEAAACCLNRRIELDFGQY